MVFNYVAKTNKHLCRQTAAKCAHVCAEWEPQICKNTVLLFIYSVKYCNHSPFNKTLYIHSIIKKRDPWLLQPPVSHLIFHTNGYKRLKFWGNNSDADGKRWGNCEYESTEQIQFTVWFKGKTGLRSTFEKPSNLQIWKYLFSSSTKWPYWLESWEAASSHHMTLIAASLYVCARLCLCACSCAQSAVVFAWADIRRSYRAYGRELRRSG